MDDKTFMQIKRAIDRVTTAVTNLVISTAQWVDDSQTITGLTMTLANTPTFVAGVYLNGQRLTVTTDYSVSGVTVTFTEALAADKVSVVYKY